jgi:hypothetical protein
MGTCSRTLGYILNQEFENPREDAERALDPLAGGILRNGYQCGMLWGGSLAIGTESFQRHKGSDKSTAMAIKATQSLIKSFSNQTGHIDCYDIADTDWQNKKSFAKYMIRGKFMACFRLAEKWAPEAVQAAREGLSYDTSKGPEKCTSCASEVVKKMGASEEETAMVAGWAGGLGLTGNACGALAAAIWMHTLKLCKETPGKSFYATQIADDTLEAFYKTTDYEILCRDITGKEFTGLEDHTEFLEKDGCKELIEVLAKA